MSLTFRTAVTASLAGFMVACGGGGDTQVVGRAPGTSAGSDKIAALEASGDIPKLDRTDSLAGTDANSNGVRDDVDAFIHQQFSEEAHRNAALQLAQALQATLFVPAGDVIQGKAAARRVTRGINCVFDSFNGSGKAGLVVDQLESITANTKIRLRTYLAYNRTLSGTVSTMPSGDTCE